MAKNLQPLIKWISTEILAQEKTFRNCRNLKCVCLGLIARISLLTDMDLHKSSNQLVSDSDLDIQNFEDIGTSTQAIVDRFIQCFQDLKIDKAHVSLVKKLNIYRDMLWKAKLKLCYILEYYICEISPMYVYYGESLLAVTLRIANAYNGLLNLDAKFNLPKDTTVCNNSCPYLMFPLKKFSVTRFLQVIAYNRAELCCHKLIDCLLETYKLYDNSDEENSSDNSSLEIYMALTKHMSPPTEVDLTNRKDGRHLSNVGENDKHNFGHLEELLSNEKTSMLTLLNITLQEAPNMLGQDSIKKSKDGGINRISGKAQNKVFEYYEQILWAEVGNFLEHIVLWWSSAALASRPPHSSQHLRDWIMQFIPTADVPAIILSALTSLSDALIVHVTTTKWDQNFRLALVASKTVCHPDTGRLFSNVLQDLVISSNQCEVTPDWILGAPLDELPLVEQIPILHRLDHSVHTKRLWAVNECKKIANTWNMAAFFAITHSDIVNCVSQLSNLKLSDHSVDIEKGGLGVHVEVCTLMRNKLISEIKVNIQKLKDAPKECVDGLASVCRTISLANLQMIFPPNSIWSREVSNLPDKPGSYVQIYLNRILTPVLAATEDQLICNMILTLICESWLDHVYANQIKFSEYGALQLLRDFAYVTEWIQECTIISQHMQKKLVKNEILKRCEGVGKLLLRNPGERLKMVEKYKRRNSGSENSDNEKQQMPAEMYVPNQEQWLELRAMKRKYFLNSLCCGK